jgi:replicative DNA helicase
MIEGIWMAEPDTWLLVRMVQSNEDARSIADAIGPADLVGSRADREIFRYIADMEGGGRKVTPRHVYREIHALPDTATRELVLERLTTIGKIAMDGEAADFIRATPVADDVGRYIEWSLRQRTLELLEVSRGNLTNGILDTDATHAALESGVASIRARVTDDKVFDDLEEQVTRTIAYIDDPEIRGLKFGHPKLDAELMPLLYSHLVLIGGATASGKSTFSRNLMANWVAGSGTHVALHTLEMSADEQLLNLACMAEGLDLEDVVKKRLTLPQREKMKDVLHIWKKAPLRLNDRSNVSPAALLTAMRRYRAEGIRVQIVDHLHHVNYNTTVGNEKRLAIGNLTRDLKTFAQDTESIVIALVQLVKKPVHVEPDESDIREAADIGEAANQILMVYKPRVACERDRDGSLWPLKRDNGRRFFEGDQDAPKDVAFGYDREHVYVKPTKQRIRPKQSLFALPFNEKSGLIYSTARQP